MGTFGAVLGSVAGHLLQPESYAVLMLALVTRSWRVGLASGVFVGLWAFWLASSDRGSFAIAHFTFGWASAKTLVTTLAGGAVGFTAGKVAAVLYRP